MAIIISQNGKNAERLERTIVTVKNKALHAQFWVMKGLPPFKLISN